MNDNLADSKAQLPETDDVVQMVGFYLAGELFAVDILMVQEIIKEMPITAIPDSPEFIEGVINLRGNIIPVIDLRKRLNMTGGGEAIAIEPWTLILDIGGRVTGFRVDSVTRVLKIPAGLIEPPPEMVLDTMKSQYISGVCKLDEQFLAILDFNKILVVDEFKRISAQKRQQNQ